MSRKKRKEDNFIEKIEDREEIEKVKNEDFDKNIDEIKIKKEEKNIKKISSYTRKF